MIPEGNKIRCFNVRFMTVLCQQKESNYFFVIYSGFSISDLPTSYAMSMFLIDMAHIRNDF